MTETHCLCEDFPVTKHALFSELEAEAFSALASTHGKPAQTYIQVAGHFLFNTCDRVVSLAIRELARVSKQPGKLWEACLQEELLCGVLLRCKGLIGFDLALHVYLHDLVETFQSQNEPISATARRAQPKLVFQLLAEESTQLPSLGPRHPGQESPEETAKVSMAHWQCKLLRAVKIWNRLHCRPAPDVALSPGIQEIIPHMSRLAVRHADRCQLPCRAKMAADGCC